MSELKMTPTRAALLASIKARKVWEDWYTDTAGDVVRHDYPGRTTRVTTEVRKMKAAEWCKTNPADSDLHTRQIVLTTTGERLLADLDAANPKEK